MILQRALADSGGQWWTVVDLSIGDLNIKVQ